MKFQKKINSDILYSSNLSNSEDSIDEYADGLGKRVDYKDEIDESIDKSIWGDGNNDAANKLSLLKDECIATRPYRLKLSRDVLYKLQGIMKTA